MDFLLVALGAAFGAPSRYLVDRLMQRLVVGNHPKRLAVGTLTVNVVGSALLGVIAAHGSADVALLLGIGWCGAFTTFSTFMAQTDESIREGWPWVAALNITVSVVLCFSVYWLTFSVVA
jgi:CrcB protein